MTSIILPSENQTREFDAKLLLALMLAEDGHQVLIGARHEIHNRIAQFPSGIYFAKDFRRPSERILKIIAGLGHHILAWDEEGLVQPSAELYYTRRFTLSAIKYVSGVFTWGPQNSELTKGAPDFPNIAIYETGNPRIDMLRPELRAFHNAEVERILDAHRSFILFDTNFASFNPAIATAPTVLAKGKSNQGNTYVQYRSMLFARWKALIPGLAQAIAPHKLIIRPHPAEAEETWKQLAAALPNVSVIHEGAAVPWMLAARVLVHSGCTTALEATVMGKVPIAFRPGGGLPIDTDLPDQLSEVAASEEQLIEKIVKRLNNGGGEVPFNSSSILNQHLSALDGELASERIRNIVRRVSPPVAHRDVSATLHANFRRFQKSLTGLLPSHKTSTASNLKRYPGHTHQQIVDKVELMRTTLKLDNFYFVDDVGAQIFRITRA